ncbi:helix-turn-helix transcriptional regulator [Spongiimicrobium salis]|uniref:helix-turn-helix transcriptional regulator n=1 Tax=Spongiimicrobium salis TaxID=1667022 RepID=UPI00374CE714
MKFLGNIKEYLQLETLTSSNCNVISERIESSLTVLWFESGPNTFVIDGKRHTFHKNQIIFYTEFHEVVPKNIETIRFLRFNRPFYCILDHDDEVGCKGMLFFGASQLPLISIPVEEQEKFDILWKMFGIEMQSDDNLQIEMLQMMLKRYLILCARLYKIQENYPREKSASDIVRDFNFLVEQYFSSKHSLSEYAELLHKSPKTLSNIFSKIGAKTPLQYIHDRKMLEARRLLRYSDLQIKEIGYKIGYDDIQAFSRFFKKHEGVSPSDFRENQG